MSVWVRRFEVGPVEAVAVGSGAVGMRSLRAGGRRARRRGQALRVARAPGPCLVVVELASRVRPGLGAL